jgi:hypothetical protein
MDERARTMEIQERERAICGAQGGLLPTMRWKLLNKSLEMQHVLRLTLLVDMFRKLRKKPGEWSLTMFI